MAAVVDRRALLRARLTPPPFDPTAVWDALGYTPTEKQAEFHAAGEHSVLFGGAAGGGKSRALVIDDITDAVHHPGIRIGAFRRTYDELEESFFKELLTLGYGEALGCKWHATARELRFPNGSVIRYRYLENVLDASRRQGGEYQKVTIDEVTLIPAAAVEILTTERLRSGSRVPVVGVRLSANPGGIGHGAVKKRYIESTGYGRHPAVDDQGRTVRMIPSKASDNPHIDAQYLLNLDGISDPNRRAAMRDGDWDSFAGMYFPEWSHDRHVVQPFPVGPIAKYRAAGIDYGYRAPWAVEWAALDGDHRLWVYREAYATEVLEREQAARILAAEASHIDEIVNHRAADPSMWAKKGEAPSPAEAYLKLNCAITPAWNDRILGWQRVHSWLAEGPACELHRAMGWDTCPLVHIFASCPDLIREFADAPYDPHGGEDLDTHCSDHAIDAFRYLVTSLPDPPDHTVRPKPPPTVMDGVMTADAPSIPSPGVRAHDRGRPRERGISTMSF